jgi:hypothetical protein
MSTPLDRANVAWQRLKPFLAPGVIITTERPPDAPLADQLQARYTLAESLHDLADSLMDAIDEHEAREEAEDDVLQRLEQMPSGQTGAEMAEILRRGRRA